MLGEDDMFGDVPPEEKPAAPAAEAPTKVVVPQEAVEAVKAKADAVTVKKVEEAPAPAPAAPPAPAMTPEEQQQFQAKEKQAEMLLSKLFMKGRIVKVSIGCPQFKKKLTAEELGKKEKDVPAEIISLGSKRLIKKSAIEKVKSIQSKAYNLIDSKSHESWIPKLRFMTDATAEGIKTELEAMKADYEKAAQEFIANYAAFKKETLKEFPDWADNLEPFYPDLKKVKKMFYFEISGFDDWKITIVRKEAEVLGDAKVAIKNSLMSKLNEFLTSSVLDARTQFIEALQTVKEKVDGGDKVNAKTIKKIQEMIEEAKAKDISGDAEFIKMLDGFSKKFTAEASKDVKAFKKEVAEDLSAILAAAKDEKGAEKVAEAYVKRSILVE